MIRILLLLVLLGVTGCGRTLADKITETVEKHKSSEEE